MGKPFTAISIKNAKPCADRREIPDTGCKGLYLVIQPAGGKSWAFRYRFAGKPKKLTLGPVYLGKDEPGTVAIDQPMTLAGARTLAHEAALKVARGIDPSSHKKRENREARQRAENTELLDRDTVEAVARVFIDKYAKRKTRVSSWVQTARLIGLKPDPENSDLLIRTNNGGEVLSHWGGRTVHEITRRDVNDLLDAIVSRGAPVTANRVLAQRADAVARGENSADVEAMSDWTFHDLRRTGASGMARLGIQLPVIEKILNHTSGSFRGVVGVYQRHDYAPEKRAALDAWASFVHSTVSGEKPSNVVQLRGA